MLDNSGEITPPCGAPSILSLYHPFSSTPAFNQLFNDILEEAWKRVKQNGGTGGIDKVSIDDVKTYGEEKLLGEIAEELRTGKYRCKPVRRSYIPKPDGRKRALGIPTIKDRIVQMAAKIVIEPVFEADFQPCSYGFRPKRRYILSYNA